MGTSHYARRQAERQSGKKPAMPSNDEAVDLLAWDAVYTTQVAGQAFVNAAKSAGGSIRVRDAVVGILFRNKVEQARLQDAFRLGGGPAADPRADAAVGAAIQRRRDKVVEVLSGGGHDEARRMLAAMVGSGQVAVTGEGPDMRRVPLSVAALRDGVLDVVSEVLTVQWVGHTTAFVDLRVELVPATASKFAMDSLKAGVGLSTKPRQGDRRMGPPERAKPFFEQVVPRLVVERGADVFEAFSVVGEGLRPWKPGVPRGPGLHLYRVRISQRALWGLLTAEEKQACGWVGYDEDAAYGRFGRAMRGGKWNEDTFRWEPTDANGSIGIGPLMSDGTKRKGWKYPALWWQDKATVGKKPVRKSPRKYTPVIV